MCDRYCCYKTCHKTYGYTRDCAENKPSLDTLLKLANALSVEPYMLLK